ncbi:MULTISPECIES: hypothetical protein [Streptomyces]|uniref:Uncharacterized protein n=2 Tax=Streptomyces TaxID=1883 RepID=A0ABY9JPW8_9ACTN|nr:MULTISPECIES: hypothetical protein [unclassified Streptomyces]WLQ68668.1 hypothetical protein P8A20_36250 [Streptomyces sp. Alt3]WSQ89352.1 hypothetical protein OG722_35655 [Streptomyces sp. NBC_01212]WSR04640.1 hypothetical protein OG265_00845 [Streptomyces sp. NBC_01208]
MGHGDRDRAVQGTIKFGPICSGISYRARSWGRSVLGLVVHGRDGGLQSVRADAAERHCPADQDDPLARARRSHLLRSCSAGGTTPSEVPVRAPDPAPDTAEGLNMVGMVVIAMLLLALAIVIALGVVGIHALLLGRVPGRSLRYRVRRPRIWGAGVILVALTWSLDSLSVCAVGIGLMAIGYVPEEKP